MVVLPVLITLLAAILCIFMFRSRSWQQKITLASSGGHFAISLTLLWVVQRKGIQVLQVGNWPAPFGITLAVDLMSALMLVITGFIGFWIAVYSIGGIDEQRASYGFYPLFNLLLTGVSGAFSTGDLFNLYVWFEVMLTASFVLIALGGERAQLEGATKYVILNLIASILFLTATGLLYALTGTLNMADLAIRLAGISPKELVTTLAILYLVAFGIKSAIFPFFFWLPASYHTPPVVVTALFSGLLTKVGVYALIRVFTLIFVADIPFTHTLLLALGGFTMVTGVLGAAAQWEIRRLLSFHIISQIGYLLMGLGLFTQNAIAGSIYFMVHVILAKTILFLVAGAAERISGSYDLKQMGGLYRQEPALALLFALPALSLAGLPPLSGFFAKLILVKAGLESGSYPIVITALAVSFLTLFSMSKIWGEAFWKPAPAQLKKRPKNPYIWIPILVLTLTVVVIGLWSEPLYRFSYQAAGQLLDSSIYIQAVMGKIP
ncbi:MAG: Na+/H+ antiporter subunit D [Anaerolineae bacterium]|nr:Na+/H+ antiporter subunit D [Anaerolineae bacterium]